MDKRVKNTTKALKQTLFDMLEQMPLSKITVTSLCKQAGVNRVTFYHHFADVYDMISQIEISYVEELKDYNFKFTQNGKVNFLWIVRFVKKYSNFYRVVFNNNIQTNYLTKCMRSSKKSIVRHLAKRIFRRPNLSICLHFSKAVRQVF